MAQAFIADLHLTAERPAAIALFCAFLGSARERLERLYILGDLFEYWVGDDGLAEPECAPVIAALASATRAGLAVSVMHGNRDFLLGSGFARHTGCQLLADPHSLTLYGVPTLLSHGDALCTDDAEYQRLRARFRDPAWQRQVLSRPLPERLEMARSLRRESERAMSGKDEALLDVNDDAVTALLAEHQAVQLIHGHTHKPGRYPVALDGQRATRVVVGDWYTTSSVLTAGPRGLRLTAVADFPGAVADVMGR